MKQPETAPTPPLTEALHIRASRPDDYEQIAAIMNLPGVRYGTLRLPHANPEQTRTWLEAPADGGLRMVAERCGVILGVAGRSIGKGTAGTMQPCSASASTMIIEGGGSARR